MNEKEKKAFLKIIRNLFKDTEKIFCPNSKAHELLKATITIRDKKNKETIDFRFNKESISNGALKTEEKENDSR